MSVASLLVPVLAQEPPAGAPSGVSQLLPNLMLLVGIGAIFYFLIIRPQQKQDRLRREMLGALKKKDRVLTSGGLYGVVADLRDDEVTLRICESPDVKIRVQRAAVVEILRDDASPGAPAK